ncbi:hypothetical protein [uncultured Corynebacterium sp.]|uniref:hypothetical protein n=1 Tax=uncultured Corynebacterium sp. TaxID=159447 RepID=UPI0025EF7FE5|nr:hypothetical protein [uncultured Corynebacterium sp.]
MAGTAVTGTVGAGSIGAGSELTVSATVVRGLARRLRDDGDRVTWFAGRLSDDAAMDGARTLGGLIHVTLTWRAELERLGADLDGLGLAADDIAAAVESGDGAVDRGLRAVGR